MQRNSIVIGRYLSGCKSSRPDDSNAGRQRWRRLHHRLPGTPLQGARCAVSEHWEKGGEGAIELAEEVVAACEEENNFDFLYDLELPLKERVEKIATELYGADGVEWSEEAEQKIQLFQQDPEAAKMATCMVKTHLSLSHDPDLKGRPRNFDIPLRDVELRAGAGFILVLTGDIMTMPGLPRKPAAEGIDLDADGRVVGLF